MLKVIVPSAVHLVHDSWLFGAWHHAGLKDVDTVGQEGVILSEPDSISPPTLVCKTNIYAVLCAVKFYSQAFLALLTLQLATSEGSSDFDKSVRLYRKVAGLAMLGCAALYFGGGLTCIGALKHGEQDTCRCSEQVCDRFWVEHHMNVGQAY